MGHLGLEGRFTGIKKVKKKRTDTLHCTKTEKNFGKTPIDIKFYVPYPKTEVYTCIKTMYIVNPG